MVDSRVTTAKVIRSRNHATLSSRSTTVPTSQYPFPSAEPIIEVSELDGTFSVYGDFRMVPDVENVTVEFAQQGVIISGGTIQRYIPIPTDGDIELASVHVMGGIARIAVPVAGLGHRWRAIVMW
ncbi:MAG TPA: hypothetical protein VFG71_13060 [Nitrospiraceae bacterium]|nr:hypothetical protein [Nitrospiraceae bacterium]